MNKLRELPRLLLELQVYHKYPVYRLSGQDRFQNYFDLNKGGEQW